MFRVSCIQMCSSDCIKDNLKATISQSYEFDAESTYNKEIGLKDHLSDILFSAKLDEEKYQINYDNRIDVDEGDIKSQAVGIGLQNTLGNFSASYSEDKIMTRNFFFNFTKKEYP